MTSSGVTDTRVRIVEAAEKVLRRDGFANLSTRKVADEADVPLSQIHYHFGSKQKLMLAVLQHQNTRLLRRQSAMYDAEAPLWKHWDLACDFYDEDLASGYVRALQEMIAAGWSDPEIGAAVREVLHGWTVLLHEAAERADRELGPIGLFSPAEVAMLAMLTYMGAESMQLLGMEEHGFDIRGTLRRIGTAIRAVEEGRGP